MRCYFMRDGHIEAVEELPGLADEEAIAKAHALFSERKHVFEGFELWEREIRRTVATAKGGSKHEAPNPMDAWTENWRRATAERLFL